MERTISDREPQFVDTTSMPSSAPKDCSSLRRVRDTVPWRLWVVAIIGFCERAAFWGLTAPWQNYMEHPADHKDGQTPGALGLGQAQATRIYCCFYIFYYVTPTFVAPVADSRLGQFRTLLLSIVLYCFGIIALIVSSIPSNLAKGWGLPGLVIALFLVGIGGGGTKAILTPFIADQYTKRKPEIKRLPKGEWVVTDYDLTLQYIYNLYYWVGNVGSLLWFATVVMEKKIGFTAAYALPLGLMVIALIVLICGQRHFAEIAHENTLPQATKIIACAIKHGFKMKCAKPDYQSQRRHRTVPWSGANVDELTRGLHCCRVLLSFIVFYVCFDQMQNNLISQASQMYTRGTPNDILPAFNQVGCIVMTPLIQYGLYPILHRRRIYLGPIMRITIGFVFVALSMIYAAFVQHAIYKSTPCGDHPTACSAQIYSDGRPSVWLQLPIYILISTGEVFCLTTGMEYAYDHSPQGMKVLVQAIGLLMAAFGSTIALALTTVAYDPNLVIFYASLAGAMTLTTVVAWLLFHKHDKIERLAETLEPPTQNATDVEKGSEHTSPTTPSASSTTLATQCSDVGVDISRLSSTSIATSDPTTSNGSSTDTLVSHSQKQPCHTI